MGTMTPDAFREEAAVTARLGWDLETELSSNFISLLLWDICQLAQSLEI